MSGVELIGVPFDGFGRPGNQAHAAAALRAAGIGDVFGHAVRDTDIALPPPEPTRGPSGLLNEPALLAMTDALTEKVDEAVSAGRFPVVFGGDCSMLLGIVSGLRNAADDLGLVFVDGHEDTMPLDVSEDGEAANTEIGLLLGITGRLLTGPLALRVPPLDRNRLAVLGPRDDTWRRRFNVGTLADCGVWLAPLADVAAEPAEVGRRALAALRPQTRRWWLHIDLDVLDPLEFAAQGTPGDAGTPGGLTWAQLTTLVGAMIDDGGCAGCSLTIYDPEQDQNGSDAARIAEFVREVLGAAPATRTHE
jgi:arginase